MTKKFTTIMRNAMNGDVLELYQICPHLELKITSDQQIDQIKASTVKHPIASLKYHSIRHGKYMPERILIAN